MKYSTTLPNNVYGHLMPPEDSFIVDGDIFALADGITRDPKTPKDFTDKKIEDILKLYPNPSGARFAADVFCEQFCHDAKHLSVKQSFINSNQAINKLNKQQIKKVDYLHNDFWGCVAVAGKITGKKLSWGVIGDCGLAIFSKTGKKKFQTENGMGNFLKYEKAVLSKKPINWNNPEYRKMIRSEYRNNQQMIHKNKVVSYGALTGENTAEFFMKFGQINLAKGDLIVFYTDGFEDYINRKDFFQNLYFNSASIVDQKMIPYSLKLAKKDPRTFAKERSLIAVLV